MDAYRVRMLQLAKEGYLCSQILVLLGLEARGETNDDLVRAVDGLAGGCSEGSCTCGSLTGGCCLLALFSGRGRVGEKRDENYHEMMKDLVRWFWTTYGFKYNGIDCMAITESPGKEPTRERCWMIMENVFFKVVEILSSRGIAFSPVKYYAK